MPRHVAGPEGGGNGRGRADGRWVGATEERRTERPQSLARPTRPCCLEVAVGDEAEQSAGGSSSASSLRGADLRGGKLAGDEASPPMERVRRSRTELHRAGHGGSQERGCLRQRVGGRLPSTTRPELARVGAVRRSTAKPICGGSSPSARRLRRGTHAGPSHGGSDDGGAPGGCAGCGSCSGATTRARRRGGVCVSELGGARHPR